MLTLEDTWANSALRSYFRGTGQYRSLQAKLGSPAAWSFLLFCLLPSHLPLWVLASACSAHKLMRHSVNNYEGKFRFWRGWGMWALKLGSKSTGATVTPEKASGVPALPILLLEKEDSLLRFSRSNHYFTLSVPSHPSPCPLVKYHGYSPTLLGASFVPGTGWVITDIMSLHPHTDMKKQKAWSLGDWGGGWN